MDTTTLTIAALTLVHALLARLAVRALTMPATPRPRGRRRIASSAHAGWRQLR